MAASTRWSQQQRPLLMFPWYYFLWFRKVLELALDFERASKTNGASKTNNLVAIRLSHLKDMFTGRSRDLHAELSEVYIYDNHDRHEQKVCSKYFKVPECETHQLIDCDICKTATDWTWLACIFLFKSRTKIRFLSDILLFF